MGGDFDLGTDGGLSQFQQISDGMAEGGRSWGQLLVGGEAEQAANEVRTAPRSLVRGVNELERLFLSRHEALQQTEIADDDAQQVVEVVGDASGELTDGLHLLTLIELPLELLALGDIARYFRGSDNFAARISNGGDGERDVDELSIFSPAQSLNGLDSLAALDAIEKVRFLFFMVRGNQAHNGTADHLIRGVTEYSLGGEVPASDDPTVVVSDDGVLRGLDDCRQPCARFTALPAFGYVVVGDDDLDGLSPLVADGSGGQFEEHGGAG